MTAAELRARTKKFALDVTAYCATLPRDPRTQEIATQLVDAAGGVGANYRSVCRARSRDDFINKLSIALDCADESLFWLELLTESRTGDVAAGRIHRQEAEELTKILAKSRATARRNAAQFRNHRGRSIRKSQNSQ